MSRPIVLDGAPGGILLIVDESSRKSPLERLRHAVVYRRLGFPLEEIGPLVVYLASAASDFMTGQNIVNDGGVYQGLF